jgi:1-deoxy-D-xylulose-5-phosphate synthase
MSLLDSVNGPADIRALSMRQRLQLADEIRGRLVEVVCRNGGHLASSLGVVELTIAILTVYDPPRDSIVWDVGHQAYPWKMLTGRGCRFGTIRTRGGLSGFPKRSESPCDPFGTGHSSTAISAALGLAVARDRLGTGGRVAAVVGDGAMSGGLALEGLNNLGHVRTDMTVILNDNEMSISRNVGALSGHLTRLLTDPTYNRVRNEVWNMLGRVPSLGERMRRAGRLAGSALKRTLVQGATVFDEFGIRYIGPVPGHDLPLLTEVLSRVATLGGPVLVHVATTKGKGYAPAECDATYWHGIPGGCGQAPGRTFTSAFSDSLTALGEADPRIVAITAAMRDGTGLSAFADRFPDRFFDVGIAEQHAVTFACGLAFGGLKPVLAVYSTFIQRAVDQVIHDAALQGAPLVIAMDRAGIVGEDGPTHHGAFDIQLFRGVPGLRLAAPRDCAMLERLLATALALGDGPNLIRFPRGAEPGGLPAPPPVTPPGTGQLLREGRDILMVACGPLCAAALDAAGELARDGLSAAVYDPIWLKPAPLDGILEASGPAGRILVLEEGSGLGGFGEQVAAALSPGGCRVETMALPDSFIPHGSRDGLLGEVGLGPASMADRARRMIR